MSVPTVPTVPGVPAVDVVVVNWNTGPHLRACLRSIAAADRSRLRVARIVVVDNASTDDSLDRLAAPGVPLHVVRNADNRGFAAACNQGARHGDSDLLLFLNPDTELYPGTLRAVAGFLGTPAARGVGILGGHMVDARGRPAISCSRFPTLRTFAAKATGLDRLAPGRFPPHHLTPAETSGSGPVDQVIGAFFLLRRGLFERLGGFDEGYFLYFEETDLARRARDAGLRSYHLRPALVHHVGQVSSRQLGGARLRHSLCSRTRYAVRHWPRAHARLLVLLTVTVELAARLARAALHADPAGVRDVLVGYGGYLRRLPVTLARARTDGTVPAPPAPRTPPSASSTPSSPATTPAPPPTSPSAPPDPKDPRHAHRRPLPRHPRPAAPDSTAQPVTAEPATREPLAEPAGGGPAPAPLTPAADDPRPPRPGPQGAGRDPVRGPAPPARPAPGPAGAAGAVRERAAGAVPAAADRAGGTGVHPLQGPHHAHRQHRPRGDGRP